MRKSTAGELPIQKDAYFIAANGNRDLRDLSMVI
jgi:hypothetical protein